jgi:DNA repair protein RadD
MIASAIFTLRPYQREAVDRAVRFLMSKSSNHGLLILPTGSGKSLCIAEIVKGLDAPCLVFQPSREILRQNFSKLMHYGFRPAVYCLSVSERILTADLRWIPCGDIRAGDRILAFSDDEGPRQWQFSEVTMSEATMAECVKVHLSDGTSVVCTLNHPWLVNPAIKYSKSRKWVLAEDLMSGRRTPGWPQDNHERRGYHVLRTCRPWMSNESYEAGWLAGIFDGEGCVTSSIGSGTTVQVAQREGQVLAQIEQELTALGYGFRKHISNAKERPVVNLYLRGGFSEQLRFLGSIRPKRLIADLERKWNGRRLNTPERLQVVALEPVGLQMVQQISTSSGTYIGEGFLMHNSASLGKKQTSGAVTLATIGSVVRKAEHFSHIKYILIDECHLCNAGAGMYAEFFKALESNRLRMIGLTATPYRLASTMQGPILKFLTRTKPRVFSEVVHYVQNGQLFRDGHLAKLEYFSIKGFDRTRLETNSTGADYTDASVQAHLKETNFRGKLERVVNRLVETGRKGVLVFTRFLEESRWLVERIPGAVTVSAETPDAERDRILKEFRAGKIQIVCNVGVLTTGFDYPELDTVVLARPTMSLSLYYQMVGRCVRPHPSKSHAMVIDMVGLMEQFGKVEDLRIERGRNGLFHVASGGKQLTNVIFSSGRR